MDENTLKAIEVIGQISKDSMSVANNHMSVANNHMSVANNHMAVANKALDTIAAIAGLHRPAIQAPPPSDQREEQHPSQGRAHPAASSTRRLSITLDFNGKNLAKSKSLDLHYLPARVDGDGEANVEEYFNNYTREAPEFGAGILTNALRGYPLVGERLKVPEGYQGLVLQETDTPLSESSDRQLRLTGVFDEFTYWNYDKVPSNGDAYRQALLIADVAHALSQPISEQDLEAEIARNKENTKESP